MVASFELETVAISDLYPHPRNYREHPEDQIEHLVASILENGFYRNIVIACDGTILAGHGVVEAARRLEMESVPVIRLDVGPDDSRALKVLVGDNEIARLGIRDYRVLREILGEVQAADDLLGTGYDGMMLANLVSVTRSVDEVEEFDPVAHWVGMPEYDEGHLPLKTVVHFRTEEDREEFVEMFGLTLNFPGGREAAGSTWWPPKRRGDLSSLRFE